MMDSKPEQERTRTIVVVQPHDVHEAGRVCPEVTDDGGLGGDWNKDLEADRMGGMGSNDGGVGTTAEERRTLTGLMSSVSTTQGSSMDSYGELGHWMYGIQGGDSGILSL